jgi:hypothetical protein
LKKITFGLMTFLLSLNIVASDSINCDSYSIMTKSYKKFSLDTIDKNLLAKVDDKAYPVLYTIEADLSNIEDFIKCDDYDPSPKCILNYFKKSLSDEKSFIIPGEVKLMHYYHEEGISKGFGFNLADIDSAKKFVFYKSSRLSTPGITEFYDVDKNLLGRTLVLNEIMSCK